MDNMSVSTRCVSHGHPSSGLAAKSLGGSLVGMRMASRGPSRMSGREPTLGLGEPSSASIPRDQRLVFPSSSRACVSSARLEGPTLA